VLWLLLQIQVHNVKDLEKALTAARAGDVIEVADGTYEGVALYVTKARLTIRAKGKRAILSGKGFDYSGEGSAPRAIVQFNPDADGCVLEGFELTGAHNGSHNGAGVRINDAADVVVRACDIHGNDMGIMSNGAEATNQRIERCTIHHNGDKDDPGTNHNLYLGGADVTLSGCEVHHSLTGHNVKSRAHVTRVEYSFIHDSANREFDLVDDEETAQPESHAILVGNLIVKAKEMEGNKAVIHFGQDGGGEHDGTLFLVHNTIVTPYETPVITLSAPAAKARAIGNVVSAQTLGVEADGNLVGENLKFDGDYRPAGAMIDAGPAKIEPAELVPKFQYKHPAGLQERKRRGRPDLGAFEK
jgi:hypothetical protein